MQASILMQRQCARPFLPVGRRSAVVIVKASADAGVQAKAPAWSMNKVLQSLQLEQLKPTPPKCSVGDSVKVGIAVIEGKGKTRTQKLEGLIIATHGTGVDKTVKFRRIFQVQLTAPFWMYPAVLLLCLLPLPPLQYQHLQHRHNM